MAFRGSSADGTAVVFAHDGSNLPSGRRGLDLRVYAKTVAAATAPNQ